MDGSYSPRLFVSWIVIGRPIAARGRDWRQGETTVTE